VYGAEVVPSSAYEIQAISKARAGFIDDECSYSAPLGIATQKWGDVVEPFFEPGNPVIQPTFADVGAIVDKFKALAYIKARMQLQPNIPEPTKAVDFKDIGACVDAFKGLAYPFDGPSGCR